jgi:RNA polymerase sigma-70 factor (ECF subfamily)
VKNEKANNDFEQVYEKEYPRLLGFIRKQFNQEYGWMDEEDLLQEVTLNVFHKLDPLQPIENIKAYIYTAVSNKIRDLFRRKKQSKQSIDDLKNFLELADEHGIKHNLYEHPEIVHALMVELKRLPDFERELLEKTSFEGYSFQQLSEEWDIPLGTLLSRKHRALAKLQKQLKPLASRIINE